MSSVGRIFRAWLTLSGWLLTWLATYLEKRNRRNKKVIKTDNDAAGQVQLGNASTAGVGGGITV